MPKHAFNAVIVLSAMVALYLSCAELPSDPLLDPTNSSVRLFAKDGGDLVVDKGTTREIGIELRLTNLLDSVYITSGCGNVDTAFMVDSAKQYDTVWISPLFNDEGQCVLSARATMRDGELKDRSSTLSLHVLAEKPGVHFIHIPQPLSTIVGKTDTLYFVTNVTGGAQVPPEYTLSVTPAEDSVIFIVDNNSAGDTARVIVTPQAAGVCTVSLVAATTYNDSPLSDTATVTITSSNSLAPAVAVAPKQIVSGKADTLVFAVDNGSGAGTLTIALTSKEPLDSSVFRVVPSGVDSIVIAVSSGASAASAEIGIIISDGTAADTSWYPVTLISPEAALWNTMALDLELIEGTPFSLDLAAYVAAAHAGSVTFTADNGTIDGTVWNYTPEWGCASERTVIITAAKGDISLELTLTLSVASGDTAGPVLALVDSSLDGKKISSSQITIACRAVDLDAGIADVVFSSGEQRVSATLQNDDIYSAVINGLVHGTPTQITITATDRSRAKNCETLTLTVTRDSTLLDGEPPAIVQTAGPKGGDRVKSGNGMLSFTVNDNSGVDSVWWALNGVYAGTPELSSGVMTFDYTLQEYGQNTIAVYARDGSQNRNTGSVTLTFKYNTVPSVLTLTTPSGNATGVGETPTFSWNGAEDADGDTVFCRVLYRKNSETAFTAGPEVKGKSYLLPEAAKLSPYTVYVWKVIAFTKTFDDTITSDESAFTTYDPTAEDLTGPSIAGVTAPANGSRVLSADGSFTVSVSDQSGVDSVWLLVNGVFAGKLILQGGVCTVAYSGLVKGNNTITVAARDKATTKNTDSLTLALVYNTKPQPAVVATVFPGEAATGVSTTLQFIWNKVTDAEGDAVYYMVSYGKSMVNLDRKCSETGDSSAVITAAQILDANISWYWQVTAYTKTPYADTVRSDVHVFTTAGIAAKITQQPSWTDSLFSGGTLTLRVVAEGTPSPTYQWYNGATPLDNGTSATYTKSNVSTAESGTYTVIVKNGVGSEETSNPVAVKVLTKVNVTGDPDDKSVNEGENVTFMVTAVGDPVLSYQWQKDKEDITTGGKSASLTVSSVTTANNGKYRCIVGNSFSKDTSVEATLTVTPTPVYTVKFDTDGGSAVADQQVKEGLKATKPLVDPTKNENEFVGWYTSTAWTNKYDFNSTITGPITIYARWNVIITYKVKFDGQGADTQAVPNEVDVVSPSTSVGTLPKPPKRRSYVFDGWYTGVNAGGVKFTGTTTVSSDVTVFANWVIKDVCDNYYTELSIGGKVWMIENLKTTRYNNGDSILNVSDDIEWSEMSSGAFCWYDNNNNYKKKYGALYNFYAVDTKKLAPDGWHIATDEEWTMLEDYLVSQGYNWDDTQESNTLGKAVSSKSNWQISDIDGAVGNDLSKNNGTLLNAEPSGYRLSDQMYKGKFTGLYESCMWWAPVQGGGTEKLPYRFLAYYSSNLSYGYYGYSEKNKTPGRPVRCVRDY